MDEGRSEAPHEEPSAARVSGELELDARLLEFLLEPAPPALELGSIPPPAVLSRPSAHEPPADSNVWLRPPAVPRDAPRIERVVIRDIAPAPQRTPTPPPPPPTNETRAERLVAQLKGAGPGLEAHLVQPLLRLGPDALPVLARSFPGLLWFNRRHPHRAVARGRDVSAISRALVAFGDAAVPTVQSLLSHRHPDVRFYATLVAQEIPSPSMVHDLAEATLDADPGVREVAAAGLVGRGPEAVKHATASLRAAIEGSLLAPAPLGFAIVALARLRDPLAPRVLIPVIELGDAELNDLSLRALAMLTGQTFGRDTKAWRRWLEKNERLPRVEWLLESLEHGHPSVFEYLCDELAYLAGERLGEAAVDAPRERKRLADAYRAFWKRR
ncbi:MAG: hypothetical protein KF729_20490 [Sandaracinaceae bacterium]|nr:hypothetical protein [Sandaracinaceae bacterium]